MAYKPKINGAVVEIFADRADKDRLNRVIHETYATESYLAYAIAEGGYYYQVKQVLISAGRLQYLDEAWESRHQIIVDANGNVTGVTGTLNDIVIPIEALIIPDSASSGSSPFYPHRESAKSLTLPNGLKVIGTYAFYNCSGFTGSLIIPDSVTRIGNFAFEGCSGFTGSLTIPNSVTSIGTYVFSRCSGFTGSLIIPDSVTSIGSSAFSRCSGFTGSLIIPDSVTSIGTYAFRDCSGFTGNLTLSNNLTSIGNYAFQDCSGFTGSLIIPNNVTSINVSAFYNCSGFTRVVFEGQAPTLNANTFYGCTSVLEYDFTNCTTVPALSAITAFLGINENCIIKVPAELEAEWKSATNWVTYADKIIAAGELEYYYQVKQVLISANRLQYLQEAWESRHQIIVDASGNVTGVTGTPNDIVIPKEALTIPDSASGASPFYPHRNRVKSLTLPNGLEHIGNYAFYNCSSLTGSLIIPNSVTSIGNYVFRGCSGFTGRLIIPNSVTSIGNYAFAYCSGFTGRLIIPNSVTSIGIYAFNGCSGFTGAVFDGQAPTLSGGLFNDCTAVLEYDFTNCTTVPTLSATSAFRNINANCIIKVPAALEAAWKTATNWVTYASKIVGV